MDDLALRAERRQITVMFCDLVGSTQLSRDIDPEDLRDLLQRYHDLCAEAVERYDGHVAQYLGDGVLAYFGFPRAHEDDARRAVHAALRIRDGAGAAGDARLRVRIGIHTGVTVTGVVGHGDGRQALAIGETPNVAARIQSLADPGTIVISTATHLLVDHWFRGRSLGVTALEGIADPIELFEIESAGAVDAGELATTFVGRRRERAQLRECWRQAQDGSGTVALVLGDPGIGKSALIRAFHADAGAEIAWWHTFNCSPYDTGGAQGLSVPETSEPGVIVLEDLHWADPELLRRIAAYAVDAQHRSVFVLATARTAESLPAAFLSRAIVIEPPILDEAEAGLLIAQVAGDPPLPAPVVARIRDHAGGIPLFLEQLTRSALEAGSYAPQTYFSDNRSIFVLRELDIPLTLRDSLTARLDRLGPGKRVAQAAAVIGDACELALLDAVVANATLDVGTLAQELVNAGILHVQRGSGRALYGFAHALLRDAAYETLLKRERSDLHERVIRAYAQLEPDRSADAALIARHYEHAGHIARAIDLWIRAGDNAAAAVLDSDALGHFSAAYDLTLTLPEAERGRRELDLSLRLLGTIARTDSYHRRGTWTDADVDRLTRRTLELGETMRDRIAMSAALFNTASDERYSRASTARAMEAVTRMFALAKEARDDDVLTLQAHHARWHVLSHGTEALVDIRRGIELAARVGAHDHHMAFGGHDTGACARVNLAQALALDDRLPEAIAAAKDAIAYAATFDDHHTMSYVYFIAAVSLEMTGATHEYARVCAAALPVVRDYYCNPLRRIMGFHAAWAGVQNGEPGALAVLERSFAELRRGMTATAVERSMYLAEARLMLGNVSGATSLIEDLIHGGHATVDYYRAPDAYRVYGELLLHQREPDKPAAIVAFHNAIELAQLQHAPLWERRARESLAAAT